MVRPGRVELPASWTGTRCSIQMSYGRQKNRMPVFHFISTHSAQLSLAWHAARLPPCCQAASAHFSRDPGALATADLQMLTKWSGPRHSDPTKNPEQLPASGFSSLQNLRKAGYTPPPTGWNKASALLRRRHGLDEARSKAKPFGLRIESGAGLRITMKLPELCLDVVPMICCCAYGKRR